MGNPAVLNLTVYQGDTYEILMRLRLRVWNEATQTWIKGGYLDLTGKTAKGQIRSSKASATVAAEFTCQVADQVVTKGAVLCSLTPAQTALLTDESYVYDIQVTGTPTDVTTYLQGQVSVVKEVTRA